MSPLNRGAVTSCLSYLDPNGCIQPISNHNQVLEGDSSQHQNCSHIASGSINANAYTPGVKRNYVGLVEHLKSEIYLLHIHLIAIL